jgi:hypothetical protein
MKNARLLTIVLVLALAGLISCGIKESTPGDTVKKMVEKMEKGDVSVSKLLAKDLAALLGDEKLKASVEEESSKMKEKGGVASVTIDEEVIEGDTAKVKYTITYGNGDTESENADLVKEEGAWKITASK